MDRLSLCPANAFKSALFARLIAYLLIFPVMDTKFWKAYRHIGELPNWCLFSKWAIPLMELPTPELVLT
ncbi:hypothetical protein D918_06184 [Trichuris suis]|nr:hypothetical protein D918_06184 [Trichuris suis]